MERFFWTALSNKSMPLERSERGFIALVLCPPGLCTGGEPFLRLPHLAVESSEDGAQVASPQSPILRSRPEEPWSAQSFGCAKSLSKANGGDDQFFHGLCSSNSAGDW